jgi:geranyl-CoA carboxylase alpha subunit
MQVFDTVLIANRGEIALRVIRSANALGFCTVAVYSDADSNALHVQAADKAVYIGASDVASSYLNAEAILSAAKRSGANAIHPGYGFLSENAAFADACAEQGIVFIGPSSAAIELMGNKRQAKIAMLAAHVPCIAGYNAADQSDQALLNAANAIGYPVMIKAAAGGGGRGMRVASGADEMSALLTSARSEAKNAFGSDEIILEKALIAPRHIEIQIFADQHGNVVYLGERDCSVQRRHQKVVEEAPSAFIDEKLRQQMGEAAVQVAKSCDYVGAGTVEFLVDKDHQFYFLEMNTRLQVEHPVTEMITGIDLVAWQLNIAAGEPLPLSQQQITLTGHAIEVRLYAEDPRQGFLPQTGTAVLWDYEQSEGIRVDHMLYSGIEVGAHYDPMLAKMIAWGETREQARRKLSRLLCNSALLGVSNNRHFLSRVINHSAFVNGEATTAFINEHFTDDPSMQALTPSPRHWVLAAALWHQQKSQRYGDTALQWGGTGKSYCKLRHEQTVLDIEISRNSTTYSAVIDESTIEIKLISAEVNVCVVEYEGIRSRIAFAWQNTSLFLATDQGDICFDDCSHLAALSEHDQGSGQVTAVMDGVIVKVLVSAGDQVMQGDTLAVMEAMKMEHPLQSDVHGVVDCVQITEGEQVKSQQLLISVTSEEQE